MKLIKILNTVILSIFFLFVGFGINDNLYVYASVGFWILIFGLSPVISIVIVYIVSTKHEFLEWDFNERKKKNHFIFTLTMVVFVLTYISVFLLGIGIQDLQTILYSKETNNELITLIIRLVYGIILMANSIFTIQLHGNLYSKYLILDSSQIPNKPDNWERERTFEDDISDRINGRL